MSRRRLVAVLVPAALLLVSGPVAGAQEAEEETLGGYVGLASGAGFSIQPVFPGLLPTGDSPVEVTGALSVANVKSGGNATGQAAAVWPGSAAANLGPLIDAGAGQTVFAALIPPYPAGVMANQDQGTVAQGAPPGPVMTASGKAGEASGKVAATNGGVSGVLGVDSVLSSSRSVVEGAKLVSEAIVTLQGISIGAGAVTIDSIKSVARTTSDGSTATSEGDTVVNGAEFAGTPVDVTKEGLKASGPLAGPVNEAIEASGITVRLAEGSGATDGGSADRLQGGLVVEMANPAAAANPQFEGSKFVIALAPVAAGALASPPFDSDFVDSLPDVLSIGSEGGGGFDTFSAAIDGMFGDAGTIGTTGDAVAAGVALDTQETGSLQDVKGVTVGLAAAGFFVVWLGSRWLRRYVGRLSGVE